MNALSSSAALPQPSPAIAPDERELVVSRTLAAPRRAVFTAWTTQFSAWWGPHGMTTPVCEMHLRPGGLFRTVMRAADGTEYPTRGVFLEVVENERIVFTDAFDPGWQPAADPFFTAIISFEDAPGGKTKLTARARHWTVAQRKQHEKMGFHQGWGESFDRLAAIASTAGVPPASAT